MHRNRGSVGIWYFGCLYGKMMDRIYGMINGYMEWLMGIWNEEDYFFFAFFEGFLPFL